MSRAVLVMGGSYFIGRRIVDTLLDLGYEVFTCNRGTQPCSSRVTNLTADRDDPDAMKRTLKNHLFDIVVDVSGRSRRQSEILCSALDCSVLRHMFFISSSAVYDVDNLAAPYRETDHLAVNRHWSSYGTDKIEAEQYLRDRFAGGDTRLVILRPPYVYGENNYAQRESFVFDHINRRLPLIIPRSGQNRLQFIYSGDLANIIASLMDVPLDMVSVFNVGNRKPVTIREWIMLCIETVGQDIPVIEYDFEKDGRRIRDFFPFHDYDNVLDVSEINRHCTRETDFAKGLRMSYIWYCQNKDKIVFKEYVAANERKILESLTGPAIR